MRRPDQTHRRGVIHGLALLSLQVLAPAARASEPGPGGAPANTLVIRSGQGFVPHTHDLWIPYALLSAPPPQGVTLTSTLARGHSHQVTLSHDQLAAVRQGGTVSVQGGSHTFAIAMALAVPTSVSESRT